MNTFTIDQDNNITAHETKKAARATGARVFDSEESLAELIGTDSSRLVEIWNSLTGVTPVKKFTSRAVGVRRIFAEIQKLASPAADIAAPGKEDAAVTSLKKGNVKKSGPAKTTSPRTETRKETLLRMISRKNGATLEDLMEALDWQKHSVRGFISLLGRTEKIESFKSAKGLRTYRRP